MKKLIKLVISKILAAGLTTLIPERHTKQSLTETNHTRWCINTIWTSDDEHCDARNM